MQQGLITFSSDTVKIESDEGTLNWKDTNRLKFSQTDNFQVEEIALHVRFNIHVFRDQFSLIVAADRNQDTSEISLSFTELQGDPLWLIFTLWIEMAFIKDDNLASKEVI